MARAASESAGVEIWLAACRHPLHEVIQALRTTLTSLSPQVGQAIKWNAPSFHTSEHFATLHLRDPAAIQVILHRGARPRKGQVRIDDPHGLLDWRGTERAILRFASVEEAERKRADFEAIVRQWMAQV